MKSKGRRVPPQKQQVPSTKYNLQRLQSHWWSTSEHFSKEYKEFTVTFDKLIQFISDILARLEHKQKFAENCTHLLLSKSLNHSFAAYNLIERGLIIDGALCARNAIEVCLMLQLFITDETEDYFSSWANEKEFSPGDIRKKLSAIGRAEVRDVIVEFTPDHVEDARYVYGFLSEITHANLASVRFSVTKEGEKGYQVYIGGSLEGQESFIRVIFAIICHYLMDAAIISIAVLEPTFLENSQDRVQSLIENIKSTVKIDKI
jgi:hypothetical protein